MIQITDNISIGGQYDERNAKVDVVLNVALDLVVTRSWPDVEYAHIPLIDGPGNHIGLYCAAVMSLISFGGKNILVCCHGGRSRSLAVVLMMMGVRYRHRWDECLTILQERIDAELIEPHGAHKKAFDDVVRSITHEISYTNTESRTGVLLQNRQSRAGGAEEQTTR